MAINWNNIHPLNNSRYDGFDELVCQLAAKEVLKGQKEFWRVGKPDGGKECFWEFENGEIYGWQAKYFMTSLDSSQWIQINKSVITTINNHPTLTKYFIAIPIDRPDAKVEGKTSMLDKWNAKVKTWEAYAAKKGMTISFRFWGSFELVQLLAKRDHEGLKYFWFNQEEFTDEWFDTKNDESINALGPRYSKELNLKLDIAKVFNGLSQDDSFKVQTHSKFKEVVKKYRQIRIDIENGKLKELLNTLEETINEFGKLNKVIFAKSNPNIVIDELVIPITKLLNSSIEIRNQLYSLQEIEEKGKDKINYYSRAFSEELSCISSFISSLYELQAFLESPTCKLCDQPYLIITGDAGMGKSHLLADIVNQRKKKNQHSLLLLGENFSTREMP